MFSFNQQTVQNVENGQALVEDNEDCKNRENFQGKEQRNTQVGDKMKEDGEENERETSELGSGIWDGKICPIYCSGYLRI